MPLASMTGFARTQGHAGAYGWSWELKSVNAKGLDLRLRLPPGWDVLESPVRALASRALSRGAVTASLDVKRDGAAPSVSVNEDALAAILATVKSVAARVGAEPPRFDSILGLRGVIEVVDAEESAEERASAEKAAIDGFERALAALVTARAEEGATVARALETHLARIAALVAEAEASPVRKPEAIRARLAAQLKMLLDTGEKFDPDRLHQEALMLATKADVQEEIDRLKAHVAAARELLKAGGPAGRKLDFLGQEFNREANTLCAKASDVQLNATGLELKAAVDQFREQVQNLE
jgi:uncharacterized protein (TIGR00255 family)